MKLKLRNGIAISVFLLLYYVYMNEVRKVMIPYSSIVIPIILMFTIIAAFNNAKGKIRISGILDKILIFSWLLIAVYIFVNNYSLSTTLISGGIIQLYTMICFMIFSYKSEKWSTLWVKITEVFVLIHALATIIFYFNSSIFLNFARMMFSGETLTNVIKFYNFGYMGGLCADFSSNGMILSIGLFFFIERLKCLKKSETKAMFNIVFHYISLLIIFYALILTSKRSPLIASILAIIITYIISKKKNVIQRLIVLSISCCLLLFSFNILSDKIPGLSTMIEKTQHLEESDAGILNGRSSLWKIAIDMFEEHPIFGNGYGSYAAYATASSSITTSAHNYYLQVLAELGIFGLVLYLCAFISGIILNIKVLQSTSDIEENSKLCIALEIKLFVIIYCMTATALMYYYILIPLFISYALVHSKNIEIKENKLLEKE